MALQWGLRGLLGIDMMMTIQMQTYQMMTRALFAFKQYALMQIEDMLIQMDNANACMTIITIV